VESGRADFGRRDRVGPDLKRPERGGEVILSAFPPTPISKKEHDMSKSIDLAKAFSRAFGVSYDMARDILSTAGASALMWAGTWFAARALGAPEEMLSPLASFVGGITAASVWARARRDNTGG
jgi:hypothetical protein